MTINQQIDASFATLGWTYDRGDECMVDRDGQPIDSENVMAALPPDVTLDELSAWEAAQHGT